MVFTTEVKYVLHRAFRRVKMELRGSIVKLGKANDKMDVIKMFTNSDEAKLETDLLK